MYIIDKINFFCNKQFKSTARVTLISVLSMAVDDYDWFFCTEKQWNV
jgi:hypothetical protein